MTRKIDSSCRQMTSWSFKIKSKNEHTGKQNVKIDSNNKTMNASNPILHPTSEKTEETPSKIELTCRTMDSLVQIPLYMD